MFSQWDRSDSPGCALGVVQNGQFIYRRNYGMAQPESKTPISADTVFYIGSMGKQFTAMSILLLVEQGKLSLNNDIRKYIPELLDYGHPITIQHLIHHTSGIPDFFLLWAKA
jgi:CubicO group peptidase (beta-lactamase class C family)